MVGVTIKRGGLEIVGEDLKADDLTDIWQVTRDGATFFAPWSTIGQKKRKVSSTEFPISLDGNDTIIGLSGSDRLLGGKGNDVLDGGSGDDVLDGGSGNDVLDGGSGDDTLEGGAGNDTYYVDSANDFVIEKTTYLTEIDTVFSTVNWNLGLNLENLILIGNAPLNGIGNLYANCITGTSAANVLDGGAGADTLNGLEGNDTLLGGLGDDTLVGGAGADSVFGGLGADRLYAASLPAVPSAVTLVDPVANTLIGGEGGDWILGDAGDDVLYGGFSQSMAAALVAQIPLTGPTLQVSQDLGVSLDLLQRWYETAAVAKRAGLVPVYVDERGNDSIWGGAGNDFLDGGPGDDRLEGGAGNDIYYVDSLSDFVLENTTNPLEIDTVFASVNWTLGFNLENLTLIGKAPINGTGNLYNNLIIGNAAANVLDGAGGADTLIGGLGSDTYLVSSLTDVIVESSDLATEIDTVQTWVNWTLGTNLENLTLAGAGDLDGFGNQVANMLRGSTGKNFLNGLEGNDTIWGGIGDDTLVGGAGADSLFGGLGADRLYAAEMPTVESVDPAENTLIGGEGNDWMQGDAGDDILYGGFSQSMAAVLVAVILKTGVSTQVSQELGVSLTLLQSWVATAAAAARAGTAPVYADEGGSDSLWGGTGNDFLDGGLGFDVLDGGPGNDTIYGGLNDDTLVGSDGDDWLNGGGGRDQLSGGVGDDTLLGGSGNDTLDGDAVPESPNVVAKGDDSLVGGDGEDRLIGGGGNDTLIGGEGSDIFSCGDGDDVAYGGYSQAFAQQVLDTLPAAGSLSALAQTYGVNLKLLQSWSASQTAALDVGVAPVYFDEASRDWLWGDAGNDELHGGAGADVIQGGVGNDLLFGDSDDDFLDGAAGIDTLNGGTGSDSLEGGDGNDILSGDDGNDSLSGGLGADVLDGGNGDDTLVGGPGADTITGGLGSDRFKFTQVGDSSSAMDQILDFNSLFDRIDLGEIDANAQTAGNGVFSFIGERPFSVSSAGQLRYQASTNGVTLMADVTGDGAADFQLELIGVTSLVAANFIL